MVYLTILPVNHVSDRVWNERGMAYPDICLEVLKKDTRIASQDSSLRNDIWTLHLLNMKHECLDRALRFLCNDVNPLIPQRRVSLAKPVLRWLRISPLLRNQKASAVFWAVRLFSRPPVIAPASFPSAFHFLTFHVVPSLLAPGLGWEREEVRWWCLAGFLG